MHIRENIREGLKSLNENKLRTILTALIIAVGIASLVSILTAIDGIQASVNEGFSNLGANTFVIRSVSNRSSRDRGVAKKKYPAIKYREATSFLKQYHFPATATISAPLAGNAKVKYHSRVTHPNIFVKGVDSNLITIEGYDIASGRNFSPVENRSGSNVAIIGHAIYETLFGASQGINKVISILGRKFRVVGILARQGSVAGNAGADRAVLIPLETARKFALGRHLNYEISILLNDPVKADMGMGEATSLMRKIRKDSRLDQSSFEVVKSQSLAERLAVVTDHLRIGGLLLGFITLFGASIGLMNIMLVSVTERTKEIGIRKALGATPQKIRQQFLMEAILVTQLGGLGGVLAGIGIGNFVSTLLSPDFYIIPWFWILSGLLVGTFVGLASGYFPAHKASCLDPITALRHE